MAIFAQVPDLYTPAWVPTYTLGSYPSPYSYCSTIPDEGGVSSPQNTLFFVVDSNSLWSVQISVALPSFQIFSTLLRGSSSTS